MQEVVRYASVESFQSVAIVSLILLSVFGAIWFYDKARDGHQAELIGHSEA